MDTNVYSRSISIYGTIAIINGRGWATQQGKVVPHIAKLSKAKHEMEDKIVQKKKIGKWSERFCCKNWLCKCQPSEKKW